MESDELHARTCQLAMCPRCFPPAEKPYNLAFKSERLYIIVAKVNGKWGTPEYVTWTQGRLFRARYQAVGGPESFRAFDVENNEGVRF